MTNISISEINSFLRCRRAWDLTSANRQSLRHKQTPKSYFLIGSAVHEAVDAQSRGGDPLEAFESYIADQPYTEDFEDSVELARGLVTQYFNQYGWDNPLESSGLYYVATEVPFSIPLEDGINFVGTFDGIAVDIETESQYYLVENKTASQKPKLEVIQSSNQFVGYNWAFRALTGQTPAGTLYNGIMKRLIKSPRVLKSGELSQDKQAGVTLQSFLSAVQKGGHDPVKYLGYLEYLEERERNGDDRFFFRELFTYSNTQLDNWYEDVLVPVADEFADMKFSDTPFKVYPNFTSCDNCLVKDICTAMQLGEDVSQVVSARYEVGRYGTMEAVDGAERSVVTSASDLLELIGWPITKKS